MMAEINPAITVIKIMVNGLKSATKTFRSVLTSNNGGVVLFRLNLLLKISTNYTKYKNNSFEGTEEKPNKEES